MLTDTIQHMGIQTSLDAVAEAERLIDALRLTEDLAFEASRDGGVRTIRVLARALRGDDQLVAIAATHALAQVFDAEADELLSRLLSDDRPWIREHTAWALGSRLPQAAVIGRLVGMAAEGGFAGMLAQRTLENWSAAAPDQIGVGLESALLGVHEPESRRRLVETLGLVRDHLAVRPLQQVAAALDEDERVRAAAVAALGQRRGRADLAETLGALARGEGRVADAARLALVDLYAVPSRSSDGTGLTVAQLFLHADIDAQLSLAGSGDNGGIATLLVRLGDALVGAGVERVITMSRGPAEAALDGVAEVDAVRTGHVYGRIPLPDGPVAAPQAWPLRVEVRRGIRRVLRAARGVDLLHLRMADVGALAAADVARELDIPVVFTVAPDPHAVIQSLDAAGALRRSNFGDVDAAEHYWFRGRLVQRLAAGAAHTVLFPRPRLRQEMLQLVGIDITSHPERHTVVPEGIDLGVVDRAASDAAAVAAGAAPDPALAELQTLLGDLPVERRGLPLLLSVGRLHRVKGMAAIVAAWADGPLAERANLLIVGGDLDDPSADEREQLDAIDAVVPPAERAVRGLLLPGHRPNDVVARWMAAVRSGVPGLAAPRGVYVCGSLKEEFGIALLEAMASGLLVVAPDGGGPATYVEPGVTGFLVPTWDRARLADGMSRALETAAAERDEARAAHSRDVVAASFTIQAMARDLAAVYERVRQEEAGVRREEAAAR